MVRGALHMARRCVVKTTFGLQHLEQWWLVPYAGSRLVSQWRLLALKIITYSVKGNSIFGIAFFLRHTIHSVLFRQSFNEEYHDAGFDAKSAAADF
jgi:hypothetical protein